MSHDHQSPQFRVTQVTPNLIPGAASRSNRVGASTPEPESVQRTCCNSSCSSIGDPSGDGLLRLAAEKSGHEPDATGTAKVPPPGAERLPSERLGAEACNPPGADPQSASTLSGTGFGVEPDSDRSGSDCNWLRAIANRVGHPQGFSPARGRAKWACCRQCRLKGAMVERLGRGTIRMVRIVDSLGSPNRFHATWKPIGLGPTRCGCKVVGLKGGFGPMNEIEPGPIPIKSKAKIAKIKLSIRAGHDHD